MPHFRLMSYPHADRTLEAISGDAAWEENPVGIKQLQKMKLAVHFHCYYTDMLDECLSCLRNLSVCDRDLYVTLVREDPVVRAKVSAFDSQAQIAVVQNCGYDVGPFIWFLRQISLDRYDAVLKVHTKRRTLSEETLFNEYTLSLDLWPRLLWDALLGSPEIVTKNLDALTRNETLGMIGSKYCLALGCDTLELPLSAVEHEMARMGLPMPHPFSFVAGTMFLVRSALLAPLTTIYAPSQFSPSSPTVHNGSLAHVMERVFGCLVRQAGYEIKGFDFNAKMFFSRVPV